MSVMSHILSFVCNRRQAVRDNQQMRKGDSVWVHTHLVWAAVVHPVLPVSVEAARTSEKRRNTCSQDILNSEKAAQNARAESVWGGRGGFKCSQSPGMRLYQAPRFLITPKGRPCEEAHANPLR